MPDRRGSGAGTERGSEPERAPLLLGLGLRCLSMNASSVPRMKQRVRAVTMADCERLAGAVMAESDPARIAALVEGYLGV